MTFPFAGVTDQFITALKQEKLIYLKLVFTGRPRWRRIYLRHHRCGHFGRLARPWRVSQYAGPAPVPFEGSQWSYLPPKKWAYGRHHVDHEGSPVADGHPCKNAFQRLGPALNSGTSIFLYGPPGNGKTSIARAFGNLCPSQTMYIPYALYLEGQVIKVDDAVSHKLAPYTEPNTQSTGGLRSHGNAVGDMRWVKIRRPFIVVGGELTLEGLDLGFFDDTHKFYERLFPTEARVGYY